MITALLLIDIQKDYFSGGKNPLVGSEEAVVVARQVLDSAREQKHKIIHVQHISLRPGATFFLPNSTGIEFHPLVTPMEGETIIQKHYPNSYRETSLLQELQNEKIDKLIICGMMTHMCVDSTARASADLGFDCTIVGAATATKDLTFKDQTVPAANVQTAFLSALNGTFAKVI